MHSDRRKVLLAGILYLLVIVFGILSIAPAIDSNDYLIQAAANVQKTMMSAIYQLLVGLIYIIVAFLLYPILKKHSESLALGFTSLRIVAAVFLVIGVVVMLSILNLSLEYIKAGSPISGYFNVIGNMLQSARDLVNHVGMIISVSISSFMLFCILYKTKLVPRWLILWGMIGVILTISASLLVMTGSLKVITPLYMGLNVPMALQDTVLAFWMIFLGFKTESGK